MLSKAEELVTLCEYILDKGVATRNGRIVLHFHREQNESPLPEELHDHIGFVHEEEDLVMGNLLVLTDDFDATVFAFRLLARSDVYLAKFSWYFFRGGEYAKFENGSYSTQSRPEEGFIELSRKTVKRWSAMIKPHNLQELGASKENNTRRLCLFFQDCFLEMYILPDGRIYWFSPLDEKRFHLQLDAFLNIDRLIKRTVAEKWTDYSVLSSTVEILPGGRRTNA